MNRGPAITPHASRRAVGVLDVARGTVRWAIALSFLPRHRPVPSQERRSRRSVPDIRHVEERALRCIAPRGWRAHIRFPLGSPSDRIAGDRWMKLTEREEQQRAEVLGVAGLPLRRVMAARAAARLRGRLCGRLKAI